MFVNYTSRRRRIKVAMGEANATTHKFSGPSTLSLHVTAMIKTHAMPNAATQDVKFSINPGQRLPRTCDHGGDKDDGNLETELR